MSRAPISLLCGLVAALAVASCAPAGPAAKTGGPTSPAKAGGEAAWNEVVAAAKREGKVVVIGPQGTLTSEALTTGFQQKYPEIQLDFSGMTGNTVAPKVVAESQAGQTLTDVVIAGTTTVIQGLIPAGALQPIRPNLGGPGTRDEAQWWGGKLDFADEAAQYDLVFSVYVKSSFMYNPSLVQSSEFKSYKDLLDPKWKSKIISGEPRLAGSANGVATFLYATPALGKDFIKQLYTQQDVTISRDDRQIIDGVAQGKYLIGIGSGDVPTVEAISRGLSIRYSPTMSEGTYLSAGNGSVAVVAKPPHPNAAKVYLDWLLSQEGQLAWSKGSGFASRRRDVPSDHVPEALRAKEGVEYMETHKERYTKLKDEIGEFLNTVLPS